MLKSIALPPGGVLSPPHLELYPFQRDKGVPHILSSNRSYLAHQPGLGKTAQAVCAVNSRPGRALVICPSFLKVTWVREITKWALGFPFIAVVDSPYFTNWDADYLIVSDAIINRPWVRRGIASIPRTYIFIDEAHRFKETSAQRTVALFGGQIGDFKSEGMIYNSQHVCAMSGTPMLNRPIELWPVLFAMAPELIDFMPYEDFGFRYGGPRQDDRGHWHFTGSSHEIELKQKVMGRFIQRIAKRDVLKDLPDKIRECIFVDKDTRTTETKALDQKLCRKLQETNFERPEELGDFAKVRHENGLTKVPFVASFVEDILTNDPAEQVILYCHHRDVVDKLRKYLINFNPMVILGGVDLSMRTMIEDRFQAGVGRLIIGNIDSMNLGLTLTKATRIVFAEYAWTPSTNEQAEDRAHRIGQKDSVFCQYLVLPDSIDEVILNSVLIKEDRIGKVISND